MSRVLAISGALAALALGSCVSQQATLSHGFAWSYQNHEGEGPKLTYGAPMSDNVVLMMTCERAGVATVSLLGGSPQAGLVLASNGKPTRFGGDLVASPGIGQMIETSARLDSQPLARFQRTGDLTLITRGRPVELDAKGGERKDVARFFKACEA